MREPMLNNGPKKDGFFRSNPEHVTGEEPEGGPYLYRMHPSEKEIAMWEKLGVKQFRLFYLATMGRLIKNYSGEKFIKGTSIEALDKAMQSTLSLEYMHTIGGMALLVGQIISIYKGNIGTGAAFIALNVLVNLYPTLMQRANRYEMLKLKKRKLAMRDENQKPNKGEVHGSNSQL